MYFGNFFFFRKWLFVFFACFWGCSSPRTSLKVVYNPEHMQQRFGFHTQRVEGFFHDLILLLEKKTDIQMELIAVSSVQLFNQIQKQKAQASLAFAPLDPSLEEAYLSSQALVKHGFVWVIPKEETFSVQSKKALFEERYRKVALVEGSLAQLFLLRNYRVQLFFYSFTSQALYAAQGKVIDAACLPFLEALFYLKGKNFSSMKMLLPILDQEAMHLFFPLREKSLLQKFNKALQKLEKTQDLQELRKKWMLI